MFGIWSRNYWRCIAANTAWILATAAYGSEPPGASEPEDCSARVATKATVGEIANQPAEFNGRCVAVDGVMHGMKLFESVDGVYLEPTDTLNPSSNGAQLGLDNMRGRRSGSYQHVSIVGRVQDCEEIRACVLESAPGEYVIVTGYCHSFNGAYLWVESLRKRKGPAFERQMGSAARPGYGDLAPAPANWTHRPQVDALADEFLEALRMKDRERLIAIHFRNVDLDWKDDEAELIRFMLKDPKSPFLDLRKRPQSPQREIFVERASIESDDENDSDYANDPDDYSATICFCREDDCTGRWPIARFDADNLRTRPYACTHVGPYLVSRKGTIPHFTTELGRSGLAEPKRP